MTSTPESDLPPADRKCLRFLHNSRLASTGLSLVSTGPKGAGPRLCDDVCPGVESPKQLEATRDATLIGSRRLKGTYLPCYCALYAGGSLQFHTAPREISRRLPRSHARGNGLVIGGKWEVFGRRRVSGPHVDDHHSRMPGWAVRRENGLWVEGGNKEPHSGVISWLGGFRDARCHWYLPRNCCVDAHIRAVEGLPAGVSTSSADIHLSFLHTYR